MGPSKDSARVPCLTDGIDIRNLSIDPFEGFMLSRIDGVLTAQEVADSTGSDVGMLMALIDKLAAMGAAGWRGEVAQSTPAESEPPPEAAAAPAAPPTFAGPAPYDLAELDEAADLPLERKREILDRFYRLDDLNYYELLGIPRSAAKKDVRAAYFSLSKVFHPDTLFGKELGSYKSKMELVFGALTKAYEVLGKKRKRKDYDFYLGLTDTTKAAEQGLAEAEVDAEAVAKQVLEAASAAPAEATPSTQSSTPPTSTQSSTPPTSTQSTPPSTQSSTPPSAQSSLPPSAQSSLPPSAQSSSPPSAQSSSPPSSAQSSLPPSSAQSSSPPKSTQSSSPPHTAPSSTPPRTEAARKTRARERLKHRFQRAPRAAAPAPAPAPAPPVERSRGDLLRGLAGSLRSAARITGGIDKATEQLRSGEDAEARGDLLAATNAYRLALSLNDNPETLAHYTRVKGRLAADLADKYKKQAKYEEGNQQWGAAALSWKKVCEGRPQSIEPLRRAAYAILQAGGDLKHARDLAQSAVNIMPTNVKCRVTLARVYIGAGMQKSALGELQEAAKLDPRDEIVKTLIRDLK